MNARTFTFTTLVLVFYLAIATSAQTTAPKTPQQWIRIVSEKADFSVAIPTDAFLIDRINDETNIYFDLNDSLFTVRMKKDRNAKYKLREESKSPAFQDPSYRYFTEGDFFGWASLDKNAKTNESKYDFHLASSEGSYEIWVSTPSDNAALAERFLRSMRLGTVQIVQPQIHDDPETRSLSVQDLNVSDKVTKALAQPDSNQKDLEVDTSGKNKSDDFHLPPGIRYSENLTILRRPRAQYEIPNLAKRRDGVVTLRVVLLANGTVGAITLVKSLEKHLDRSAFEAAKKLKFIPAEIDGKPVDVTKLIEYHFEFY